MNDDDRFCPLCGVTLELHDGPDDCGGAEAKARVLDMFERRIVPMTGPKCDSRLALRYGSAACDLWAGHVGDHEQAVSSRVWSSEDARQSWLMVDEA